MNNIKYFLTLIILLLPFHSISQNENKQFLDGDYKPIDEKKATYYKTIIKDSTNIWSTKTYYINGKLFSENFSFDKNGKLRTGPFIAYYPDGNIQLKGTYCDNTESDLCGFLESFKPKGIKEAKYYFSNNKICGYFEKYDDTGTIKSKGKICNKRYIDTLIVFYPSGSLASEIIYNSNGTKLISENYFKIDGSKSKYSSPEFEGGDLAFLNYLEKKIKYPTVALRQKIKGYVYLSFDVCEDGKLCNFEIIESPSELLSQEALRVISKMPNWKPAEKDGVKIRTNSVVPIKFDF